MAILVGDHEEYSLEMKIGTPHHSLYVPVARL